MRWNVKPHGRYRGRWLHGLVKDLYDDCAPWPQGRSNKRDAMIEEITRLNDEQSLALDPNHCIYEIWNGAQIQPCGETIWTHTDLCDAHKPFVESLPWEYRFRPRAGTHALKYRNAFYGLPPRFNATLTPGFNQPKAIERILGKERKAK